MSARQCTKTVRRLIVVVVSMITALVTFRLWTGETQGRMVKMIQAFSHTADNDKMLYRADKKILSPKHQEPVEDTLTWVINIASNRHNASEIICELDLENLGQVGHEGTNFLVSFRHLNNASNPMKNAGSFSYLHAQHKRLFDTGDIEQIIYNVEARLHRHSNVKWYSHQKVVSRQKRWMHFKDPFYKRQWHLRNTRHSGMDTHVESVWWKNITGIGVTVCVVDDGIEWNNPDLLDNYNAAGSWDLTDGDANPMPDNSKATNHHGTRCAGEITAVPNNVCGVGVAYGAKVSGLRILDGPMTDSLEATAFTMRFQVNDIYSCSWGPDDDGMTVDGPHILASIAESDPSGCLFGGKLKIASFPLKQAPSGTDCPSEPHTHAAMKRGIDFGRHGYGSIYVVASGNGGTHGDNCNYDGYANSMYTVTIGAVDETGHMPYYGEECASMLAVTFSNGGTFTRDIVTTDWTSRMGSSHTGCTEHHSGTSAAAPIAAGLIALMLQVQPCLTWRDVQYLIILTAQKVDVDVAHWQKNGAGLWHSHKHGFGLMNAWRMVNAAQVWNQVPWLTSYRYDQNNINTQITKGVMNPLKVTYTVTKDQLNSFDLYILETVQVTLTLDHPCRGHLQIELHSPQGTASIIGATRPHDNSSLGFDKWTFSTVRCWGETPAGTWTLVISDLGSSAALDYGILRSWSLKLYGTPMSPQQLTQRRRTIEEAMHGRLLNRSSVCSPPPVTAPPDSIMDVKTLKVLSLSAAFIVVMAIYESLEYLFCYNDEKKEHAKYRKLLLRAHRLATPMLAATNQDPSSHVSETTGLLTEDIAMETFRTTDDIERSATALSPADASTSDSLSNTRYSSCTTRSCDSLRSRSNMQETNIDEIEFGEFEVASFHGNGADDVHGADNHDEDTFRPTGATVTIHSIPKAEYAAEDVVFKHKASTVRDGKVKRCDKTKSGYTLLQESSGESEDEF